MDNRQERNTRDANRRLLQGCTGNPASKKSATRSWWLRRKSDLHFACISRTTSSPATDPDPPLGTAGRIP
jgi:hypothetical protein